MSSAPYDFGDSPARSTRASQSSSMARRSRPRGTQTAGCQGNAIATSHAPAEQQMIPRAQVLALVREDEPLLLRTSLEQRTAVRRSRHAAARARRARCAAPRAPACLHASDDGHRRRARANLTFTATNSASSITLASPHARRMRCATAARHPAPRVTVSASPSPADRCDAQSARADRPTPARAQRPRSWSPSCAAVDRDRAISTRRRGATDASRATLRRARPPTPIALADRRARVAAASDQAASVISMPTSSTYIIHAARHGSPPSSRSESSRRMRSSSSRPSFRSDTNCANIRSAEPWKIASRIRASALPPARSAPTVGK